MLNEPEEPLKEPRYVDTKAEPGQEYIYFFRALRLEGKSVDSMPIKMHVPFAGHLSPEQSIRVRCWDITAPRDLATFKLYKVVDGKLIDELFYVKLGERIGEPRKVAGVGMVDFTTDLVLSEIREGDQALAIRFTEPLLDKNGHQLVRSIEGGFIIPATREHDKVMGIRTNLRAILKTIGRPHDEPAADVWQGGSIRVAVPQ